MARRLLLIVVAVLLVLFGVWHGEAPSAAEDPGPAVVLGARMGVNEGVAVPRRLIEQQGLGLTEIGPMLVEDAKALNALGSQWVRLNSVTHPFTNQREFAGFEAMDQWLRIVQEHDLDVVVVLSPWSGNGTARQTARYVIQDESGWQDWVRAFGERYDGDGVEDMPGLREGLHHWEVDNEPDLKNDPPGGRGDPDFCTVAQYIRVFDLTEAAIRQADAQAKVLNGGIYRPHRPQGQAYLKGVLDAVGDRVDIVSIHLYADDTPAFLRGVDNTLALAGSRPVWITETSVSSEPGETQQAEKLEAMVRGAFDRGVERLFWHSLNDPPAAAKRPVGMGSHSLYHHGMVPKEAAAVWTRLATGLGAP